MDELRSALRGDEFDKDLFIDKMKVIDEMIIDQTPLADKFVKKYDKKHKQQFLKKYKKLFKKKRYKNFSYFYIFF